MALEKVVSALKKLERNVDSENSPQQDEVEDQGYFCVEDSFLTKDINVIFEDIGKLSFPLTEDIIKQMITFSSKAMFGRGEATLLDASIRDTQIIPASKLQVDINEQTLAEALYRIGKGLNIDKDSYLVPHLYNMLIYGPGQFFKIHRDSEKLKNMVATLVIVLPSKHRGGDLIIQHKGKKHIFFGSQNPDFIKCVIFYSDCHHEIKEVIEGFRVALTYNVVLESPEIVSVVDVNERLNKAVHKYFFSTKYKRLVYYLNHSYSEHSLKWNLLKGLDRTQALALFAVAKKQDRVPCLALADYREEHDGDDGDCEMLDSDTQIVYCVDEHSLKFNEKFDLSESEICYTTKTTDLLEPYKTEEEPHTGNAGGTTDYWYRRACVILWSSKWVFSKGLMDCLFDLHKLTSQAGNENLILDEIKKAGPAFFQTHFWHRNENASDILLDLVIYLKDPSTAVSILSKLQTEVLDRHRIDRFLQLEKQYGSNVWNAILKQWEQAYTLKLNKSLMFVENYVKCTGFTNDSAVITYLLNKIVSRFIDTKKKIRGVHIDDKSSDTQIKQLCKLFQVCSDLKNVYLEKKLLCYVVTAHSSFSPIHLTELLLKLKAIMHAEKFFSFKSVKDSTLIALDKQLSEVMQQTGWYLPITITCNCEFCVTVQNFLHSKDSSKICFPVDNKATRWHVYSHLNPYKDKSIKCRTQKGDRPFKIVIEKMPELLKERQALMDNLTKCKNNLQSLSFYY